MILNLFSLSQSGITYYTPQTQLPPRPILPQRRPTNAIPILAPPERAGGKQHQLNHRKGTDDDGGMDASTVASIGSPENIDHILDNMFVQRAPYQPPTIGKADALKTAGDLDAGVSV